MKVELTSTLYLIASAQAVLMMVVLWRKNRRTHSEKYLVATLAALTITLLHYVSIINQLVPARSVLMDVSAIAWLCISPLLFLYVRALVGKEETWSWSNLIYFPFSIYLLVQMVLISAGSKVGFFLLFSDWNTYTTCWILLYLLNSLFFSGATIYTLRQSGISAKHQEKLRWLEWFFGGFSVALLSLIVVLLWSLNAAYFMAAFEYYLLVFYAVFIFGLTFKSLRSSHYFNHLSNDHYGPAKKNEAELARLFVQLEQYMQSNRPYLQPKLSLADLAKGTGISENHLSQIFTRHLNANFYQYINTYRLRAFEQQLTQQQAQQYTIMALAEESGFASKATFYKVFKAHYGMTPSEFVKQA